MVWLLALKTFLWELHLLHANVHPLTDQRRMSVYCISYEEDAVEVTHVAAQVLCHLVDGPPKVSIRVEGPM